MTRDDLIAAHLERLSLSLADQAQQAGGWPKSFVFPEPADDTEREALRLFVRELEQATGIAVRYTTGRGSA